MAESQNVERKESWRDEYLKWICGFADNYEKQSEEYVEKNVKDRRDMQCKCS